MRPIVGGFSFAELDPTTVFRLRSRLQSVFPKEGTELGALLDSIVAWGEVRR